MRKLNTKKDKYTVLKNNILIRVIGYGYEKWKTTWSEGGRVKLPEELARRLKEIIVGTRNWKIPPRPEPPGRDRRKTPVLGTATGQVRMLDDKAAEERKEVDQRARVEWKSRNERGDESIHSSMQLPNAPVLDKSFVGQKIEYYFKFDVGKKYKKEVFRWCSGTVKKVCDGTWVKPGHISEYFKEGEAVLVKWKRIKEAGIKASESIVELKERLWNKDIEGAWRKDHGEVDFGIKK